ncbi:unnamed protein product [Echinostoma caproni]|uniref:G_PROTEIN_RECEP_F1_2 domain-containing protein n=1 Tax=Echinostoma caproni TaxID=27848 RepID=A0A183AAI0_9TREM|nr:unnamed protein product [Echinostoma caproni]
MLALAEMALQSIQLGISLQNTSDLHMDKIDQNQLETMRATFIRFQAPEFLKGAILETDKDAKCSRLTTLVSGTPVGQIIQTHVQPFIIIFTLITNCVTSIVLTRPAMRNPTNTFLFGIAIADLLTVLLPLPIYLSSLTSNLYREQLSPFKGYAVSYLATLLPTMFHTSAIWITVLLAVQRFIYVQYPLKANGIVLCQTGPVKWFTFSTVLFALLFQLPQMIFLRYHRAMSFRVINQTQASVPILHSRFGSIVLDQLCVVKCTPLDARFMFILLLCRVTFVHVIPSVLLTILTGQLIVALHRFAMNRRKLLNKSNSALRPGSGRAEQVALVNSARLTTVNGNQTCKSARKCSRSNGTSCSETDSTSRMMLVVLGIFLLVELPTTACICFYAFSIILKRGVSGVFFEVSSTISHFDR